MSFVFISYSHKDSEEAENLHIQLQERNFEVWIDNRILPGDRWENEILKAIKDCGVFVVLMSNNSLHSAYVAKETDHAISLGKTIIPVLLSGSSFPKLSEIQYVDYTAQPQVTPQFEAKVRKALRNKLAAPKQVQSLEYYVEELEKLLRGLRSRPVVAEVLKFQKDDELLKASIVERLTPYFAQYDIDNQELIDDLFDAREEFVEFLREYADEIESESERMATQIEDLTAEWEAARDEDPDAIELPVPPPTNDPSMYCRNLFDE